MASQIRCPLALRLGVVLVVAVALTLAGPLLGTSLLASPWSLPIALSTALLLCASTAAGRSATSLAVCGCLLGTLSGILMLQVTLDYYGIWVYAWTLLPAAIGAGFALAGGRQPDRAAVELGGRVAAAGLLAFVLAGVVFEVGSRLGGQVISGGSLHVHGHVGGLTRQIGIVVTGLLGLAAAFTGDRAARSLAVPAGVAVTVGAVLLFQSVFDLSAAWAYAWALVPVAVGHGLVVNGLWSGKSEAVRTGSYLMLVGGSLFMGFGVVFELLAGVTGLADPSAGPLLWPVLAIGVGVLALAGNLQRVPARGR